MAAMTIEVWGERCEVTIYEKLKGIWICEGNYLDQYHSVTGRTERAAITRWREAALYNKGVG